MRALIIPVFSYKNDSQVVDYISFLQMMSFEFCVLLVIHKENSAQVNTDLLLSLTMLTIAFSFKDEQLSQNKNSRLNTKDVM